MIKVWLVLKWFVVSLVSRQLMYNIMVVMLLVCRVMVGVKLQCFCSQIGDIRIIIIMLVDSSQVSSIEIIIVFWCLSVIVFIGSFCVSVLCCCILRKIGVFCSQWCRYIVIRLNMLFSRKGICQLLLWIFCGVRLVLISVVIIDFSRMLIVRLVVSVLQVILMCFFGICLVINIQVSGILLLIVVFCRICISSNSSGVMIFIELQVGSRLIVRVGSVISRMLRVNIFLCFIRLLKWVMMMFFSGCVR